MATIGRDHWHNIYIDTATLIVVMTDIEAAEQSVTDAEALAAPQVRGGLNPDAARLFRVYRTIANMLDKRGYMVPKGLRELTPANFKERFGEYPNRDALTLLVEKADDDQNQLFVFFPEDEKVGVKPIKVFTDRMRAENVSNAIMILRDDITAFAKQAVQEMSDAFRIEHFKEAELLVDITKHQLVPEHQLLTPSEKQELLKRYRLKDSQLPRIQQNDPVARYYGMRRGQVVKIIRPSETAGRYVTYRVCV
jgi:DNA-directed RNA polymerase I, II, and III subunit RPABC1